MQRHAHRALVWHLLRMRCSESRINDGKPVAITRQHGRACACIIALYIRKTPNCDDRGPRFWAAAKLRPNTMRVSAGSMTPSSQSLAEENDGSPSASYLGVECDQDVDEGALAGVVTAL